MLDFLKNNYSLYLSIFLLCIGLGFQNSFIAPLGAEIGISHNALNYVINFYYIGFLLGIYLVPKIINKSGYVRSFSILGTTFSAGLIGFGLFQDVFSWSLLRGISGICFAGLYVITESWINSSIDNKNRGTAMSLYLTFLFAGVLIGNYLVRYIEGNGIKMLAIISFILSLSFIPVLLMRFEPKNVIKNQTMKIKELYETSPMGSIGILFVGIGYGLSTMMTVYLSGELNADKTQISNFLVIGALLSLPSTYLIGKLSDKSDRRIIIISLSITSLLGAILIYLQSSMNLLIYLGFIILNIGLAPLYSVCIAQTNDWLKQDKRIAAASKLGFLYGLGSVIGGFITSVLVTIIGAKVLVELQVIIYTLLIIFAVYRYYKRQRTPEEISKFITFPSRPSPFGLDIYKIKKKKD